jgi:hypothetical protein
LEETEMREDRVNRTLLQQLPLLAAMCLALNLLQFAAPAFAQQPKKKPAPPPPPAAAAQAPAQEQDAKKPNILFIMCDDIGWMQPGIYHRGLMVGETPNIDRIGQEGAIFMDYVAMQS